MASWPRRGAHQASLTPGRVRLLGAVLVLAVVALGVVTVLVLQERRDASDRVQLQAAPALVAAAGLYVALADADTTASRGFLVQGLEPVTVRQRYDDRLRVAASFLAEVSASSRRLPATEGDVRTLTAGLPEYSSLVEAARANDRQEFVLGAAYLRQASNRMREELLPAATRLYAVAAEQLDDEYDRGMARRHVVWLAVAAGVALAALLAAQVWLMGRFRRILNLGLLGATVAVIVSMVAVGAQLASQHRALQRSRVQGSEVVKLLSAARILTLRAYSDANLVLIERGTGDAYLDSYDATMERIGDAGQGTGLLGRTAAHAERYSGSVALADIDAAHTAFTEVSDRIRSLDDANEYQSAVGVALTDQVQAAADADKAYEAQIELARGRFAVSAESARTRFEMVAVLAVVLTVIAAVLVIGGLRPRVREYR